MGDTNLVDDLQMRRQELVDDMRSLVQAAESEERVFSDEEQEQFTSMETEVEKLDARLSRLHKIDDLESVPERRTAPQKPAKQDYETNDSKEKRGRTSKPRIEIPPGIAATGTLKAFTRERCGSNYRELAYLAGRTFFAAAGHQRSRNWLNDRGIHLSNAERRVHEEGSNWTGGVYVTDEHDDVIILLREEFGVARRVFRNSPMMSDRKVRRSFDSGLTAYYVGEGDAITESTTSTSTVTLVARKIAVISTMTNELNEDSIIDIGDMLTREIAYAFASKEDDAAFLGDGTSTYGGVEGLINRMTNDGTAGVVTQGTAGDAETAAVLGDFTAVVGKLPQYADTPNTAWICSRQFFHAVMAKLQYAAGGNMVENIAGSPRFSFLGYPVVFSQKFPTTWTDGDGASDQIVATLGDYSLAGDFGDRRGTTIAFSDSATVGGVEVFEHDEMAIRGTERFAVNIHNVGDSSTVGPIAAFKTDVA